MERKGLATYILYRVGNQVSSTNLKGVAFLFFGLQMFHYSFHVLFQPHSLLLFYCQL